MQDEYVLIYGDWRTIEEFVNGLQWYKDRNIYVKAQFNGEMFYSDKIALDDVYQKLIGFTKAEYDIASGLCDKYIRILGPEKYWDWEAEVRESVKSQYFGEDAVLCLEVAQALKNGDSFENIEEMLYEKTGNREDLRNVVLAEVAMFCDKGEQFQDYVKVVDRNWEREER